MAVFGGCITFDLIVSLILMKVDFHVFKTMLQSVSYKGQQQVGTVTSIERAHITWLKRFPGSIYACSNLWWMKDLLII
jgi:hypothetical protein